MYTVAVIIITVQVLPGSMFTFYAGVCMSVNKICQKAFHQSTSFLVGAFPRTEGRIDLILRTIGLGVREGMAGSKKKFWLK